MEMIKDNVEYEFGTFEDFIQKYQRHLNSIIQGLLNDSALSKLNLERIPKNDKTAQNLDEYGKGYLNGVLKAIAVLEERANSIGFEGV